MKNTFLYFATFLFTLASFAQNDKCAQKEEEFGKIVQDREYAKAYELMPEILSTCPAHSEKMYVLATQVLQYNIESSDADKVEFKVLELIKLLDAYDKNFPENTNGNFQRKALALYDNKIGTDQEIYDLLDKSFNFQRETFTNSQLLYIYLKTYFQLSKEDKSAITNDDLIGKYISVTELANYNASKFPPTAPEYNRVLIASKSLFSGVLTCENLTSFSQKGFEKNSDNISWLESTALAFSEKCKSVPVFEKIGLQLHKLNPSAQSAYYLGDFYLNTSKQERAIEYFNQSVSLSKNPTDKAKNAYVLATILANSNKSKAKEMIDICIQNDNKNGKYYVFLANLYATSVSKCSANETEKKAIYKLASDTVLKAAIANKTLQSLSEKMSADFLKKAALDKNTKKKEVKLNCWINETVQL